MTALLDLAELADRAGVPATRLWHFDDAGLLPAARRDDDRYGYHADEATVVRRLDDADRLGIPTADLTALAAGWRSDHTGPCGPDCPCATALTAPAAHYQFPKPGSDGEASSCDLAADGGDAQQRIGAWQRVQAREPLPDAATGLALRFPLDGELAAAVARLAAAEYRCCSFGSYTLVIDDARLTLQVRMPDGAADELAAVLGTPDPPAQEAAGATDRP